MWVPSLLLLLYASGGRTKTINGDFPSWSLDHMDSLVGERILLSSGTHLAATATTATGLKLQEWGLPEAKLREIGTFPYFLCLLEATVPNPKNKRRWISLGMLVVHTWYTILGLLLIQIQGNMHEKRTRKLPTDCLYIVFCFSSQATCYHLLRVLVWSLHAFCQGLLVAFSWRGRVELLIHLHRNLNPHLSFVNFSYFKGSVINNCLF